MTFYSIVLRRKHIVSTYGKRGEVIETRETFLEETHSGLPASTIANYRSKFPDAVVSVSADPVHSSSPMRKSTARTTSYGSFTPPPSHTKSEKKAAPKKVEPKIHTGDLSDLVNKLARESA